jgi:hypothetical protein
MEITEVTRRAIADRLAIKKISWSGQRNDDDFLSRIYDLEQLPSHDGRFKSAAGDIWQHRVNNLQDWEDDWIFSDVRFNLLHCEDEAFLRFLVETLHPCVRTDSTEVETLKKLYNEFLGEDGFELYASSHVSGRPIFSARRIDKPNQTSNAAAVANLVEPSDRKIPRPVIYTVAEVLGNWYYSHTKLNVLFGQLGAPGDPPPGNCITKCQNWLFQVNDDPAMDAIGFLGELLTEFMSKDMHGTPPWSDGYEKITRALAKQGLAYDPSGKIVIAQTSELLPVTPTVPPPSPPTTSIPSAQPKVLQKRFDIALSFPGEHRLLVSGIVDCLAQSFAREKILYDRWYEHELARPDLDVYLQRLYHDEAKLIVVFLCAAYESKEWCGLEWRAIRDLVKKRKADEIMFVRLDNAPVSGTFSIDGYLDAQNRAPAEIAVSISKRFQLLH